MIHRNSSAMQIRKETKKHDGKLKEALFSLFEDVKEENFEEDSLTKFVITTGDSNIEMKKNATAGSQTIGWTNFTHYMTDKKGASRVKNHGNVYGEIMNLIKALSDLEQRFDKELWVAVYIRTESPFRVAYFLKEDNWTRELHPSGFESMTPKKRDSFFPEEEPEDDEFEDAFEEALAEVNFD